MRSLYIIKVTSIPCTSLSVQIELNETLGSIGLVFKYY